MTVLTARSSRWLARFGDVRNWGPGAWVRYRAVLSVAFLVLLVAAFALIGPLMGTTTTAHVVPVPGHR